MNPTNIPERTSSTSTQTQPPPTFGDIERVARGTQPPGAAIDWKEAAQPKQTLLAGDDFKEEDGMFQEPAYKKWARRIISVPALFLATLLYGLALIALVPISLVRDWKSGKPGKLHTRFHIFIFSVFAIQLLAVRYLSFAWVRGLFLSPERRRELALDVEIVYIPKVFGVAERVYGMKMEVEGLECCSEGPVLLLSRHASILDTIMPIKLLSPSHRMGMRIVQKDQLLWNPVVDIASRRMPRAFVKRGSGDPQSQVEVMKKLLKGMGNKEALVVFPEGSRFTPEKKKRVVEKIAQRDPKAAAAAQELQSVLPIRPAGTTALMEERPDMDIVFMAHTGLEKANRLEDFAEGKLYNRTVKIKFWRVSSKDVPTDPEERVQWLHSEWAKVDRWIVDNRDDDMIL